MLQFAFVIALGAALLALLLHGPKPPPGEGPAEALATLTAALTSPPAAASPVIELAPVTARAATVRPGSTLYDAFRAAGVPKPDTHDLIATLKPHVDPRRLAAGTAVAAYYATAGAEARPTAVELQLDRLRLLRAVASADGAWRAEVHEEIVETEVVGYTGVVTSNLWVSATAAGMDPNLITQLAEIFAWQVDFNREVQENDRWRLTVERRTVDGEPIGYGDIIAAEYENVGVVFSAVRFDHDGSSGRYYTQAGQSLRRMFLRSPLKYGRITSGFQAKRHHPILGVNRAHKGVDYGAPTGTPVLAVGDGVVTFAARHGASGKMISIRHNAVYTTKYKHLSGFAAGIAAGTRVGMGQVIGFVGSTGLATGPHLHYEFHDGGRYVDPQGIKFPTADPVPAAHRVAFLARATAAIESLPAWTDGPIRTAAAAAE